MNKSEKDTPPTPAAGYHIKVVELVKDNPWLFPPGRVTHVTVAHDSWCGIHRDRACSCDPTVRLAVDESRN